MALRLILRSGATHPRDNTELNSELLSESQDHYTSGNLSWSKKRFTTNTNPPSEVWLSRASQCTHSGQKTCLVENLTTVMTNGYKIHSKHYKPTSFTVGKGDKNPQIVYYIPNQILQN